MRESGTSVGATREPSPEETFRMDLQRGAAAAAAFRMENAAYLQGPLTSPTALMVLASTADTGRAEQQQRAFAAVAAEKEAAAAAVHIPFSNGSYAFASLYHRPAVAMAGYGTREFPPPGLLHLHPQFATAPPPGLGLLGHSGVGAFRPFASPGDDRDGSNGASGGGGGCGYHQSAFTPAKRLKGVLAQAEAEGAAAAAAAAAALHLRFAEPEEYGPAHPSLPHPAHGRPSASPGSLKLEEHGKMAFTVAGLVASDRDSLPSPQEGRKKASLFDGLSPTSCPVCGVTLRPGELRDHLEQELNTLRQLFSAKKPLSRDPLLLGHSKLSPCSSSDRRREGDIPSLSPISSEDLQLSDRYQTFLRVRSNRQSRLNARIGKNKRKKPSEEGQYDGSFANEDEEMETEGERRVGGGHHRYDEFEWCRPPRLPAPPLLDGATAKSAHPMLALSALHGARLDGHDSDADLDVDGDDTLDYGKPQYSESDIIACSTGDRGGEQLARDSPRPAGASVDGSPAPCARPGSEAAAWPGDETPSTSAGEADGAAATAQEQQKTAEGDAEKTGRGGDEVSGAVVAALKTRIHDLERQVKRGDKHKCLICMDSYTLPLTSIQCWHVHCEECWLRTLGAKKLCPQCNTITSPGDLRRVFL